MLKRQWIEFQELGDSRGSLVAIEVGCKKQVPFEIKRIYYIFKTGDGISRGFHAHRKLRQVFFAVSGCCDLVLDDGSDRVVVGLDTPARGLLVGTNIWREMRNFSPDCVLLVLASEHYDEEDYIRDYDEFLREVGRCAD